MEIDNCTVVALTSVCQKKVCERGDVKSVCRHSGGLRYFNFSIIQVFIFIYLIKTILGCDKMTSKNGIKVLPSKVILSNGSIVTLDELKKTDKEKVQSCICKNISNQISNYYSSKQEEWENFISVMT